MESQERRIAWMALLALAVLSLAFPSTYAAEDASRVRVWAKDQSYEQEVVVGQTARSSWIVFNFDENATHAVLVSVRSGPPGWNVSTSPSSFTLAPGRAQEVSLTFAPTSRDVNEANTVEVVFNFTEVVSGQVPITFESVQRATFTVVEKPSELKSGMDISFFSWKIYHLELPAIMDNNWGRFLVSILFWFIFAPLMIQLGLAIASIVTSRTKTTYDDLIIKTIRSPLVFIVTLYGVVDSLIQLEVPSALHTFLYKVVSLVAIAVAVFVAYRLFKRVFIGWLKERASKTDTRLDDVLVPILDKVGTVLIIIVSGLYLLSFFGIDVTVLVAGMGVAGLVIAFAAQETFSNFFAGLLLLLDRPFEAGDTIILENGDYCRVLNVGLRSTRLYDTFSDDEVSMPNSKIANQQIINVSKPDRKEKVVLEVNVSYGSDAEKVERILLELVNAHPNVVRDQEYTPTVRLTAMGDSSIKYKAFFTVDDFSNRWRVSHELRKQVLARFRKEGIEIPLPQQVVHLKKD